MKYRLTLEASKKVNDTLIATVERDTGPETWTEVAWMFVPTRELPTVVTGETLRMLTGYTLHSNQMLPPLY